MGRQLKPCGTVGGYARHRLHKEPACAPCLEAYRVYQAEYRATRRRSDAECAASPRQLQPCGTYAGAQRHRVHGETVCAACEQATRDYKAEKARVYRAALKARRVALDQMLAEAWEEVSRP